MISSQGLHVLVLLDCDEKVDEDKYEPSQDKFIIKIDLSFYVRGVSGVHSLAKNIVNVKVSLKEMLFFGRKEMLEVVGFVVFKLGRSLFEDVSLGCRERRVFF